MRNAERRTQSAKCRAPEHLTPPSSSEPDRRSSGEGIATGDGRILVTRRGLAVALGVSLSTVERMLHDEEIEPVRLRGVVRFYVPDVLCALSATAVRRKNGRKARVVEG